jgi:hypothetical protein
LKQDKKGIIKTMQQEKEQRNKKATKLRIAKIKKTKNNEAKQSFCPIYIQELSLGNRTTYSLNLKPNEIH